jgi:hypothetical protein
MSMFSSSPPPAAVAPTPAPPPVMPDPNSPDAVAAKRQAQQDAMGRAGRSSTILSTAMSRTPDSTGATPAASTATAYGSSKLGSAA